MSQKRNSATSSAAVQLPSNLHQRAKVYYDDEHFCVEVDDKVVGYVTNAADGWDLAARKIRAAEAVPSVILPPLGPMPHVPIRPKSTQTRPSTGHPAKPAPTQPKPTFAQSRQPSVQSVASDRMPGAAKPQKSKPASEAQRPIVASIEPQGTSSSIKSVQDPCRLARAAFESGHPNRALLILVELLQVEQRNGEAWWLMGQVMDDPEFTSECLRRAKAFGYKASRANGTLPRDTVKPPVPPMPIVTTTRSNLGQSDQEAAKVPRRPQRSQWADNGWSIALLISALASLVSFILCFFVILVGLAFLLISLPMVFFTAGQVIGQKQQIN